jgi:hypothetical protein
LEPVLLLAGMATGVLVGVVIGVALAGRCV